MVIIDEDDLGIDALQQSERRLSRAQAIAHVGDWEWELATNDVHWSAELFRIYGFEPDEIAPDYGLILAQMHPDSKEEFLHDIDAALKGKKPFEMDYTFFRRDGSTAMLHTIGQVFRDDSGAPVRMAGVVQDITDRKKAEMLLQVSENKFKTIFDKANDGIMIADAATRNCVDANASMCEMLGYSKEEILGIMVSDIHPKADLPAIQDIFEQQMRGDILLAENIPVKRKDGSLLFVDINSARMEMAGKACLVGFFRDVTERRQAEEKNRQNEVFVRGILDSVDEGFIVVNRDYQIITANRAFCQQVGLLAEQIIGRHCFEVSHKYARPCFEEGEECSVKTVFASGRPHAVDHRHEDADGNEMHVETKAFPLRDISGTVVQAIETINNVTEKRLLEEEQLKVEKLEAIGILAGGIAHDFNNLLMGILGNISLIKNLIHDEKLYNLLHRAEKAAERARNLTMQLLTFSKGGAPVKDAASVPDIIEESTGFVLSGSNVDCGLAFGDLDKLWPVEVDKGQLSQVINNLTINAMHAMPRGGKIVVQVENKTITGDDNISLAAGDYVLINFIDQGCGIDKKNIPLIFDPYFSTKSEGSGLGLAAAYSIIKNHGGLLSVESKVGVGTTFHIYLPALSDGCDIEKEKRGELLTGQGKILVMDDEAVVLDISGEMLMYLGYQVETATEGSMAIDLYQKALASDRPFDGVILDLTIPGKMGGKETVGKLLQLDPLAKVIVSSGYANDPIMAEYQKYGFKGVVVKPFNLEKLSAVMAALLAVEGN
ncbi:MAG: PAS domain S-box protein [Proteobacteria bacterium]|nr:PAS domain S-box protein [Pseudomonadota bacterium]MBU1715801.1 PAS domain S-box protein [Pseudomonadota bacterium]